MVWIVLYHYTARVSELYPYISFPVRFENGGLVGVTIFFVISGFFLFSSISNISSENSNILYALRYAVNKYWRFWPAYAMSVLLTFLCMCIFPLEGRIVSFEDFLINVFFIYHGPIPFVDSAHWFLAELIKVQILSTIFILLPKHIRSICLLIFECFIFALVFVHHFENIILIDKFFYYLSADSFLRCLIGYNIYSIISNKDKRIRTIQIVLLFSIVLFYSYTIHFLYIPLYIGLVIIAFCRKSKSYLYRTNMIETLSSTCFAWYLIHQNIGYAIMINMNTLCNLWILQLIVPAMVTFAIAYLITKLNRLLPNKIM